LAHAVTFVVAAAVASPLVTVDEERTFPLSRYPMFAFGRSPREALPYAEVTLDDGTTRRLGYTWWTAGGVGTARNQLERMEKAPPGTRRAFCNQLAGRVAASDAGWASQASSIRIATGTFAPRKLVRDGDTRPLHSVDVVTCKVPRP
jgi:hypothetical protein